MLNKPHSTSSLHKRLKTQTFSLLFFFPSHCCRAGCCRWRCCRVLLLPFTGPLLLVGFPWCQRCWLPLTHLVELDLTRNYFSGSIPKSLANLPLTNLSLLGNNLTGPIPPEISDIATLLELNLEDNQLGGSLPPSLGNLSNLKSTWRIDLQMLVYENYNKFISATNTIKRMKSNISGMETHMEQLLEKIMSVQSRSDTFNTSLFDKREHIEKLHRTCNLLRKVQFIYDLPDRLNKCIKLEAYADAIRFYTGAMPILKAYGDSSFQDCKIASEEAMATIVKNLQGKLFSDSESIQKRAEAAVLLKQLEFPVRIDYSSPQPHQRGTFLLLPEAVLAHKPWLLDLEDHPEP